MDLQGVQFEVISYRGLIKSLEDIQKGNFMKKRNPNDDTNTNNNFLQSVKEAIITFIFGFVNLVETFLFFLMSSYDDYVYSPLQKCLSPICRLIPRYVYVYNKQIPVFTANIVTLSRTFLVIPIAWFLKYDYNLAAFLCVVFHDFLDHLDGIVAKVQRDTYPNHDDSILGGFLDAFCDKVVNILSLWTLIQAVNFDLVTNSEATIFLVISYSVIAYETIIGIIRVQDFFNASFKRDYKIEDKAVKEKSVDASKVTMASMEGKLKEKLESMGIAFLCLSIAKYNQNPINNAYGLSGLICLLLTLRMAHKSLTLKLQARKKVPVNLAQVKKINSASADNLLHFMPSLKKTDENLNLIDAEMKMVDFADNKIIDQNSNYQYKKIREIKEEEEEVDNFITDLNLSKVLDERVDKVYTIGCFDLFHFGHIQLIKRMRKLGRKVIVGVHDSRSIYKLKNRVPIDSTTARMLNVKQYADEVFCIAGTDPSIFISCIVNLNDNETALYVRGDDMQNFPSRQVVENLMPIKFLPYTKGVSSTQLRKEKFSHIAEHDENYLEKID